MPQKPAGSNGSTPKAAKAPIVTTKLLTRVYPLAAGNVVGIDQVTLSIQAGELVVLKGNSGSGKSTLLSLIGGLDRPTSGDLQVAGSDLTRAGSEELTRFRRQVVGMIFQSFNLLPTLTVLENICLPALLAGRSVGEAQRNGLELASWLGMKKRLSHLPSQLSGGEMQRTAIARSLINDPAIVLADEPTGNLDSKNGAVVMELLRDLNQKLNRTVIVATHSDLADDFAHRKIHLRDGALCDAECSA